jgi:transcriptional regulator NrdR family protein
MICPYCGKELTGKRIIDCRNMSDGRVCRRNRCESCGRRFNTIEAYVPDGQEPSINTFRRHNATVLWHPEKAPKAIAFIKRR